VRKTFLVVVDSREWLRRVVVGRNWGDNPVPINSVAVIVVVVDSR
jgi:hypothetical protein